MLFSILITSYNQEKTITDTIRSCLAQTYQDYEIVISDDGSTDRSIAIIESFTDPRIRFFKQEKNLREYNNRNFLVKNAKGEYVIFIDAEDIIYPHALEIVAYYLKFFPGIGMMVTQEWTTKIIYPVKLSPADLYRLELLDSGLFGGNFTNLIFRRDTLIEAGLFPTHIKSGDTYMQFKLALTEPALIIGDIAWWRNSPGNVTQKLNPEYCAKDYCHLADTIHYKVEMLDNPLCPLTNAEIHQAKLNLYGGCLRMALRWLLKFKFKKLYYLFKGLKIPSGYYKSLFIPAKNNFFSHYSGSNPMHTPVNFVVNEKQVPV